MNMPSGHSSHDEQSYSEYGESSFDDEESFSESDHSFGEYYSYESEPQPSQRVYKEKKQPKSAPQERTEVVSSNAQEEAYIDFDLRQAVIAQTILHNDYIDDRY